MGKNIKWKKVGVKSQLGFEIGAKTQYSEGQTCHLSTFFNTVTCCSRSRGKLNLRFGKAGVKNTKWKKMGVKSQLGFKIGARTQ